METSLSGLSGAFPENKKALAPNTWDKSSNSCGTTRIYLHYTNTLAPRTTMRAPLLTGGVPVSPNPLPDSDRPRKSIPHGRRRRFTPTAAL